jgi:hypothetical protein
VSEGSFLSRWSRRKAEVAKGVEAPEPVDGAPEPEPPSDEPTGDALKALIDALPKLDELTRDTDFTAFLAKGVPAALRDAALRKLWSLDPELGKWSDMAEYAWDWNTPGMAPGYGPLEDGFDAQAMLERILPRHDTPDPDQLALDHSRDEVSRESPAPEPHTTMTPPVESAVEGNTSIASRSTIRDGATPPEDIENPGDVAPSHDRTDPGGPAPGRRKHGGALPRLS